MVLIFLVLFIKSDLYEVFAKPAYLFMLLVLLATIFIAPNVKGSHSWIVIGSVRVQPAEFAKLTTALMLAHLMGQFGFKLHGWRTYAKLFATILVPMGIIILQSEAGSALVFLSFFLVLYREGMTGFFLGVGTLLVLLFVSALSLSGDMWGSISADHLMVSLIILGAMLILMGIYTRRNRLFVRISLIAALVLSAGYFVAKYLLPFNYAYVTMGVLGVLIVFCLVKAVKHYSGRFLLIAATGLVALGFSFSVKYVYEEVLKPHQQMRIAVALGLEKDLKGVGYNVHQAEIAIGSGGLVGKGFMGATQTKLNYVPEQETDFIFCTVAEEYGFLGATTLLLIYLALILRLMHLAGESHSAFCRIYGYCVACILLMHIIINIGMVLGLVPVIGIPLPFCSYGGSSLWSFTLMLFIFLRLQADDKLSRH